MVRGEELQERFLDEFPPAPLPLSLSSAAMASQPATSKRHELELGGLHFPLYEELPPYGDAPFRGWTFLGEIIKDESYGFGTFGRPLARVRDLSGKADILIAFYLDADQVSRTSSSRSSTPDPPPPAQARVQGRTDDGG